MPVLLLIWYCKRKSLYIFLSFLLFSFFKKGQMYLFLVLCGANVIEGRKIEGEKKWQRLLVCVGGWVGGRAGG
jgi:hypothetical protein